MEKLPKIVTKKGKRVGRGYGSGKGGHTAGRGQKGQKSRSKINVLFEGVKVKKSLLRRLPLQRGKGKMKPGKKKLIVNIEYLNLLKEGQKVDAAALIKAGIIRAKDLEKSAGIKILGRGKLTKKLHIFLPTSSSAARKIVHAQGKIVK